MSNKPKTSKAAAAEFLDEDDAATNRKPERKKEIKKKGGNDKQNKINGDDELASLSSDGSDLDDGAPKEKRAMHARKNIKYWSDDDDDGEVSWTGLKQKKKGKTIQII